VADETATALPSTWSGPELAVVTGRVPKYRRELASLHRDDRPSDALLALAAQVDAEIPLRPSEPAAERERCGGCARCERRKTVRRGRVIGGKRT
jgi:hypothetical protein